MKRRRERGLRAIQFDQHGAAALRRDVQTLKLKENAGALREAANKTAIRDPGEPSIGGARKNCACCDHEHGNLDDRQGVEEEFYGMA